MRFTPFSGLAAQKSLAAPSMQPAARSGLVHKFCVEARVLTRRESVDKRHKRIRSKVEGTTERPRLAVFRSNNHIYAQVIDDSAGNTLAATSTLNPEIRQQLNGAGANVEAAKLVGAKIAELCKQKNIEKVCFDRGGFRYHGRVEALADAAREAGLSF
ncbi:hypothetical protein CHLNCDRAFT_142390 [Chlorella variabilis]|uniref:Large ribosomal subunit protein uL18c n=1 Tax=Chlorella variabilis TaxID=554065 RepID=E1Z8F9_CHLVA|nr:hypothetical protein CHLNCDRAFT_142390 [Chlorella variabilis]EFN58341.1 hypothetical protein CHLNCDRAFT_142390 [Chlorella variabilis]|eukprot:XP_005850443.1 hypothetical protein CHLNCDRAFT_142390 [Chlorella variabilis]